MTRALVLLALILGATAARAGLTSQELSRVGVDPPPDARLDLGTGRPAVLVFADFTCGALCDAILAQTAGSLAETGLSPETDYALVVVGIDPRDDEAAATAFVEAQVPPALALHVAVLRPDAAELERMTRALGYGYVYDEGNDRFAHPAARYVLTADGDVSRVVPAFEAGAAGMKAAILDARRGVATSFARKLALFCYGYDPVTGRYSLLIERVMMLLAAITAIVVGSGIAIALRRERRRAER